MPKRSDCVKCGGRMEAGFILDHTGGAMAQSHWVEGEAEQAKFLGILAAGVKTQDKMVRTIDTYRCSTCGYLESYAVSESERSMGAFHGKKGG